MDPQLKILYFFIDLVLPLAIGYLLRRFRVLKMAVFDRVMLANLVVFVTALTLFSLWNLDLRVRYVWLPVLGVLMQLLAGAVGFLMVRGQRLKPIDEGSFLISAMLSNRGVVGVLSLFVLFGETGYAYAQMIMLLAPVVTYAFCFPLAGWYRHAEQAETGTRPSLWAALVNVTQIPTLAVVAGLALSAADVPRPEAIATVFPFLVHLTAWLFGVPLGYSLEFSEIGRYWKNIGSLSLIKFIITPAAVYGLAVLLGFSGIPLACLVILSCSPTAINAVIVAKLQGLNVHLSMSAFVLTTVVYLAVVLPILFLIFAA